MCHSNIGKYTYCLLWNKLFLSVIFSLFYSCSVPGEVQLTEDQSWKLEEVQ